MVDRDRLIELLDEVRGTYLFAGDDNLQLLADYLLANGVIVPPCKVGDYVRFKGLTTLWQVDAIHYYREGLPQISVTNGKITNTVTDFETFEVVTKEQAEKALDTDKTENRIERMRFDIGGGW